MPIEIREVGPDALDRYATVSIAFEVRSVLRPTLIEGGLGGIYAPRGGTADTLPEGLRRLRRGPSAGLAL